MKIAVLIARLLLGFVFFVFGLNSILQFMKAPPMPPSDATAFADIMMRAHYMNVIGILMLIAGLLLLVGRYVPLALTLLGPILVNILMFHFLVMHGGAEIGLVVTALELFLIWAYRSSFRGLFDAAPDPS